MLRLLPLVVILWGVLLAYPVRSELTRSLFFVVLAALEICAVGALWRFRWVRWLPLLPLLLVGLFLVLPGRTPDAASLRRAYIAALHRYEGTSYVWGGEGVRGVDCSGLLRAALVDAHTREALMTLNPELARRALWFWWHDASAMEMLNGYKGETAKVGNAARLMDIPAAEMTPGDFAVTEDCSHVLAWLAPDSWIEADPEELKVMQLDTHQANGWNRVIVVPCRWVCFK